MGAIELFRVSSPNLDLAGQPSQSPNGTIRKIGSRVVEGGKNRNPQGKKS
jgi:hypothetical protein